MAGRPPRRADRASRARNGARAKAAAKLEKAKPLSHAERGRLGGRPPEPRGPDGINWKQVRRYARLGADRDTIVLGLGFTPEQLRDPAILEQLQREMAQGEALHRLDLLEDVDRLRKGGDGSVNATIASLRQALGWDRPDSGKNRERARPDQEAAVAELQRMLQRFGRGGHAPR